MEDPRLCCCCSVSIACTVSSWMEDDWYWGDPLRKGVPKSSFKVPNNWHLLPQTQWTQPTKHGQNPTSVHRPPPPLHHSVFSSHVLFCLRTGKSLQTWLLHFSTPLGIKRSFLFHYHVSIENLILILESIPGFGECMCLHQTPYEDVFLMQLALSTPCHQLQTYFGKEAEKKTSPWAKNLDCSNPMLLKVGILRCGQMHALSRPYIFCNYLIHGIAKTGADAAVSCSVQESLPL